MGTSFLDKATLLKECESEATGAFIAGILLSLTKNILMGYFIKLGSIIETPHSIVDRYLTKTVKLVAVDLQT